MQRIQRGDRKTPGSISEKLTRFGCQVTSLASEAKVNFSMFWPGAGHRQATVNDLRGTGILEAYLATLFNNTNNGYEKITQKNFPFQKSHLKLALTSNSLCGHSDVYNYSRTRHYNQRTKIYENLSTPICVYSPSK